MADKQNLGLLVKMVVWANVALLTQPYQKITSKI